MSSEDREAEIKKDLIEAGAPEDCVDFFYSELSKRMKPTPKTVRALVEMKCLGVSAVDGIRKALQVAIDMDTEEVPIVVTLLRSIRFISCQNMIFVVIFGTFEDRQGENSSPRFSKERVGGDILFWQTGYKTIVQHKEFPVFKTAKTLN